MEEPIPAPPPPETPVPRPVPRILPYAALIIPLVLLIWVFLPYPSLYRKANGETFLLSVEWGSLLKMAAVFYGLYLLPGLAWLAFRAKRWTPGSVFRGKNILTAFALGCSAHILAALLQKYLHLPYRGPVVVLCMAAGYLLTAALASGIPWRALLSEDAPGESNPWEAAIADTLLLIALFLGLEMTLRGRGSSLNLSGDGFPHLISFLGTLTDGPMPDALPFYTTRILNVHPMAFHAMLADLKTLIPSLFYIDMFRYFSVLMVPIFVGCMMGFFTWLGRNRLAGAFLTLSALFVSGGGLSLSIPIVFYPWYWSIAWCLAAAVVYLLLKDGMESPGLVFFAGWMLGVGVLLHPVFAFRMGAIMAFFLPLEILRRFATRQKLAPVASRAALFALGAALPVAIWLLPMVLRYGWEETYSYDYIVENFSSVAPEGVRYIRDLKQASFSLPDLWRWSYAHAGIFALFLSPLGMAYSLRDRRNPVAALLWAWLLAMGSAVVLGYLPNSYRYFEFFFFGICAMAAFGLGRALNGVKVPWRLYGVAALLAFAFLGIRRDFFPKYVRAVSLYGRTSLTPADVVQVEKRSEGYFRSKRAGNLDRDFGSFPGYLWSRQKKVWDIYVQNQKLRQEK